VIQLNPQIPLLVVGGSGWKGPTGKGVALFVIEGGRDDNLIWTIAFDDGGAIWCVDNRYVRAVSNITYGRTNAERI
jgi:hypothetical protein